MLKRIISYMKSVHRPVSIHDIARATGVSEVDILGEMNIMQKKGMCRIEHIPLSSQIRSSTYYVISNCA